MRIEEFKPEKKWWDNRKENEFAWKVSAKEIKRGNYNLDIKNPNALKPENGDPEKLLVDYKHLLEEIGQTRDALKKELMDALGGAGA